ncbi:uncharacterized protein LOC123320947 [Coccinella septempunctata]|uniref:uncharacterized protein LOC123320946 n=1 Tax=Coccinella septempunctata TaxID=41139 RepID=UPI001D080B20|nr:uncharacterized protein LOC123320946 [Coccinella septempunctata]XP_044764380.1 uncharacterized protein LOC123320947 [Coccinella septempunctata]
MGFFLEIANIYGTDTVEEMKAWADVNRRLATKLNRRIFLLRCRQSGVIPRHISDSVKNLNYTLQNGGYVSSTKLIDRFVRETCGKMLSMEIKMTCSDILKYEKDIAMLRSSLVSRLPYDIFRDYSRTINRSFNTLFKKVKSVNMIKFEKLCRAQLRDNVLFQDNSNWFRNLSDIEIPRDVSDFLSLGPDFSVGYINKRSLIKNVLMDVENILSEVPQEQRDITRAQTTNIITNFNHRSDGVKQTHLQRLFRKTQKFLKNNPELYIVRADKGGSTVAMNKQGYIEKTKVLLADERTYRTLRRDPTAAAQKKLNELLRRLHRLKEITDPQLKHLTIYNSAHPKLYTLPKIHKENIPMRPIVSSVNTLTYKISKFIADILKVSFHDRNEYNIKDTFAFVDKMRDVTLPEGYILISLDVVSLFTNIPLDLILEILRKNWDLIKPHTTLSRESFIEIIEFIFNNAYLIFDGEFYEQIFGTPMGSPLSAILATIILDYLLDMILPTIWFHIPFFYKFVDDLFCAIPADKTAFILDTFNGFNANLKFTMEVERDNSLPFLDTRVIRSENNRILLDWYQKPTASGRFINFHSQHPYNQKINMIKELKNRVCYISDESLLKKNLRRLFEIFQNNGYPKNTLNRLIHNRESRLTTTTEQTNSFKFMRIPFVKDLTPNLIGVLNKFENIKLAKYNLTKVGDLFSRTKEKTPIELCTNAVYKISCQHCDG